MLMKFSMCPEISASFSNYFMIHFKSSQKAIQSPSPFSIHKQYPQLKIVWLTSLGGHQTARLLPSSCTISDDGRGPHSEEL